MRNIFEKYAGDQLTVSDVHTGMSTFHAEPTPKAPAQSTAPSTAQTKKTSQQDGEVWHGMVGNKMGVLLCVKVLGKNIACLSSSLQPPTPQRVECDCYGVCDVLLVGCGGG